MPADRDKGECAGAVRQRGREKERARESGESPYFPGAAARQPLARGITTAIATTTAVSVSVEIFALRLPRGGLSDASQMRAII